MFAALTILACAQDPKGEGVDDSGAMSTQCSAATEVCDGLDNDCDGEIDEDPADGVNAFIDVDGDGHGSSVGLRLCSVSKGYAEQPDDCDDGNAFVHPGAGEICGDGIDNDCTGQDEACVPPTVLSTLDAAVQLTGIGTPEYFALEVAGLDHDGDGIDDLAVSAYDATNGNNAGATFIFLGESYSSRDESEADIQLYGNVIAGYYGRALGSAGDVDGDGLADLLLGEINVDPGRAYLLYGGTTVPRASFVGEASDDFFGDGSTAGGDLNEDGYDDFIIGAPRLVWSKTSSGALYVYFGGPSRWDGAYTTKDAGVTLYGGPSEQIGDPSVGTDLNGDGVSDLAVTDNGIDRDLGGRIRVFQGPLGAGLLSTDDADTTLVGDKKQVFGNYALESGDCDGDGYRDLVGTATTSGKDAHGIVHLLPGPTEAGDHEAATRVETSWRGDDNSSGFGHHLAVYDLNGDGNDDVIISDSNTEPSGVKLGGGAFVYMAPFASGTFTTVHANYILEGEKLARCGNGGVLGGAFSGSGSRDIALACPYDEGQAGALHIFEGPW